MMTDFTSDWGKQVFPPYCTTDAFKKKFKKTMNTLNAYGAEIGYWMHMNEDYVALGHMNLNVDNAYFWRTPEGKLDCGVFDWGGMGTSSYGIKLWWYLYCSNYEVLDKGLDKLCETFCEHYKASGGPQLDAKELEMMVIISGLQQMPGLMAAVPQIIKMCGKKNWPEIKDRYDPRIALNVDDKSTLRTYIHCMNNIIRLIEEKNADEVLESFVKDIYVGRMNQTAKTDAMING